MGGSIVPEFDPNQPYTVISDKPEFDPNKPFTVVDNKYNGPVDPETGEPMWSEPSQTQKMVDQFGRTEPDPLGRVGGALTQPFKDTQWGIPQEFTNKFMDQKHPNNPLNAFNDIILNGVASPLFMSLQALGAGADGVVDAMAQAAIESGADPDQAYRGARDVKGFLEVAPAYLGAGPIGTGERIRAPKTPKPNIKAEVMQETDLAVEQGLEASRRTGIDITKPQATLDPFQLESQNFVAQLPSGSRRAMKFLEKQNQQAYNAVEEFMGQIAPASAVETGPTLMRSASQRAIESAKDMRRQAENGQYRAAFAENPAIDVSPILQKFDDAIARYPETGSIAKDLKKFRAMVAAESKSRPGSMERLHNVKVEMYENSAKRGGDGLGPKASFELGSIYDDIRQSLEDASGTYASAQSAWREASPGVDAIVNSTIGKVAKFDDTQLKNVSRRIFDAEEINPATIKASKTAIDNVDKQAWNEILRVELERRMGTVKPPKASEIQNLPGDLRASIFGNTKQRKVLFAGMSEEQKLNAMWLDEALRRASLGRTKGSQTWTRKEIADRLGLVGYIRNMAKDPKEAVLSIGEKKAFDESAARLAKLIYDPMYTPEMRKLRKYSDPTSPGAIRAFEEAIAETAIMLPNHGER